jgi:hypothetical protein
MCQCGTLSGAQDVYAYYGTDKRVTVVVDLFLNPFTTEACICPNPLAVAGAPREFIVERVARRPVGVHPPIEVKQRITSSFAEDSAPASVVVYTMGVDAPELARAA